MVVNADTGDRPPARAQSRGTPGHRTDADVTETTTSALFLPGDSPGFRIIIPAAVDVMAARGYFGTSIREIGERAGMSPTAMYHHFRGKQELLFAIMARTMELLIGACRRALAEAPPDPASQLAAFVRNHVVMHVEMQRETLLSNTELRSLEGEHLAAAIRLRDDYQRILADIVAEGVTAGVFRTAVPEEAVRAILTMTTAVPSWYRAGGPTSPSELAEHYAHLAALLVESRA